MKSPLKSLKALDNQLKRRKSDEKPNKELEEDERNRQTVKEKKRRWKRKQSETTNESLTSHQI